MLSTAGLLRADRPTAGRATYLLRISFAAGIIVSLAANIAAAPSMTWAPILVADWPPIALLLAVELVGHQRHRDRTDPEAKTHSDRTPEKVIALAESRQPRHTAEQIMWDHYKHRVSAGLRPPTGAELDQVAQTNNYGRAVLRKWRRKGRTSSVSMSVVE